VINWSSWLLWGFLSTLVLTTVEAASQGLGLTRMNLPYMLGTVFTPDRDKAKMYGFLVHVVNGWAFSLVYVLVFASMHEAGWWRGAIVGVIHGFFVLSVVGTLMPGIHPRMASEQHGPTASRELEPPGFMLLNYGVQTPASVILSHALFGALLGAFYVL
jgi:hypothetical protein